MTHFHRVSKMCLPFICLLKNVILSLMCLAGAGRFGHMTIWLQVLGRFVYCFLRQLGYNSETVDNSATTNSVTKLGQFGYSQGEYKSRKI